MISTRSKARTVYTAIMLAAIILLTCAVIVTAEEVSYTYDFGRPFIETDEAGYSIIVFPSTIQSGAAGRPSLPWHCVRLALPVGTRAGKVTIAREGWNLLPGSMTLLPRQRMRIGEQDDSSQREFICDRDFYGTDRLIEPDPSDFTTHRLRGHSLATGSFTPVSYNPAQKIAGYYSRVTITVETLPEPLPEERSRPVRLDDRTLRILDIAADNRLPLPMMAAGSDPMHYDYMIVTTGEMAAEFQPLCDFYNRRGILTRIVTTEYIYEHFTGRDPCEMIRNAIIQSYSDFGIEYVLLGGDVDVVPHRQFFMELDLGGEIITDSRIPSDIYFSNLDGNWNSDGDHLWAEHGEEDLYSEISVGRACISTAEEAAVFVRKSTMYQDSPVAGDLRNALLLGEELLDDPLTYGGDALDQLIDTSLAHGISTEGIPSGFNITKYYDRDMGTWSPIEAVFGEISEGAHWVLHDGHCNSTYALRLGINAIMDPSVTNDGVTANFVIVNTTGCLLGAFDKDDCIAERMLNINHFALALVCNSRYGIFSTGSTSGPSQCIQREFIDAVFGDGLTGLGPAHHMAKDAVAPYLYLPDQDVADAFRWCFYCNNLLGDPAIDVWTDIPVPMAVSHSPSMEVNDPVFNVDTGTEGAVGALYWNGICRAIGVAGPSGTISIDLAGKIPPDTDSLVVTVTAHDRLACSDTITVDAFTAVRETPPAVRLDQNSPNPFNPSTSIGFSLEREGYVDIRVYDTAGRLVDILLSGRKEAGDHILRWDAGHVASGIYFYVMRTDGRSISRKAVLLR